MSYELNFTDKAKADLRFLKKSEPQAYKKAQKLINELVLHPRTGTGKPSIKKHNLSGHYSRKITDKHRLVYSIHDNVLVVEIVSAKGHYDDK